MYVVNGTVHSCLQHCYQASVAQLDGQNHRRHARLNNNNVVIRFIDRLCIVRHCGSRFEGPVLAKAPPTSCGRWFAQRDARASRLPTPRSYF